MNKYIEDLILKADTKINYNESLLQDDAAIGMLGITRVTLLRQEVEELRIFKKVLNTLVLG